MKKIYAFTLKSKDGYIDEKFSDDLRLLAYMLYDSIYNSRDDNLIPLNIGKNIYYNNLNEIRGNYKYSFDSDLYDDGVTYYEPFIIGNNTFCFTVIDGLIDEDMIVYLLRNALNSSGLDYEIDYISVDYYSKDIDDEGNREKAIKNICDILGIEYVKRNGLIRKLFNNLSRKFHC